MTGRIIYTPPVPTLCDRELCADKPEAEGLRDGTIWECDHCARTWIVWSGAQYNEPFSAWRRTTAGEVPE
jgi:hypothetical protein